MEQLTSTRSSQTYRVGQALPALGEGFYRGYAGMHELTLRVVASGTPAAAALAAEAALLATLRHLQIVPIRDAGESERYSFVVIDSAAERPLAELVHQSELSITAALDVVLQIAAILDVLHSAGIAWGRLRPQAFWIDRAGVIKLINLRGAGESVLSGALSLAEATYLAPELSTGQLPSVRSDVYALGVLAYELLAGRPPFAGNGPTELAVKHMSETPADLGVVRPDLPPDLVALVNRCMRKQPDERLATPTALREALQPIQDRLLAAERARMVTCPRCQGLVTPAERCPLCNAPLRHTPTPITRRRLRRRIPLVSLALMSISLLCAVFSIFDDFGRHSVSSAAVPTLAAPTSRPAPTALPSPLPTATAAPLAHGTVTVAADDVSDPDIDLIRARSSRDGMFVTSELTVVGRIATEPNQATYQILFDTDPNGGDTSAPWANLNPDLTLLYRSGDEAGMALRWQNGTWQGIGTVETTIEGGTLRLHAPAAWFGTARDLRYGTLAISASENLADYAPARTQRVAQIVSEKE